MQTGRSERNITRPATAVAGMRAKVNITLTVLSSVYLILHKPLLIYIGRVAQVAPKCICYYKFNNMKSNNKQNRQTLQII